MSNKFPSSLQLCAIKWELFFTKFTSALQKLELKSGPSTASTISQNYPGSQLLDLTVTTCTFLQVYVLK